MSVYITEEGRWQGMMCVTWLQRVSWSPNSHLAAAQGQEDSDMGCGGSTMCFVQLCPAHSDPATEWGPLNHPMLIWSRSLEHHDVSLEKGMCSQEKYTWEHCIIPSLESFDDIHCKGMDYKSVCNYSNILLIRHTGAMSQTCHRVLLGGGSLFYKKGTVLVWLVWVTKIFHCFPQTEGASGGPGSSPGS